MKEKEKAFCEFLGLKMDYDVIDGPSGTIVICDIMDCFDRVIAIGTSICSPLDKFDMEYGMDLAFGRAFKAMTKCENVYPIVSRERIEYNQAALAVSEIYTHKGVFIQLPALKIEL